MIYKLPRYYCYLCLVIVTFNSQKTFAEDSVPNQEVSLSEDRKHLDELRKNIPEEIKQENDELAFVLKLFDDKKRNPTTIQREFNRRVSSVRKKSQRHYRKLRKDFDKEEKAKRKVFLKKAKEKRTKFLDKKPNKEKRDDFFTEERSGRKEFFAEEREKRRDFESETRAKQKEFESQLRDRRKEFDQRMKEFRDQQRADKKTQKEMSLKVKPEQLSDRHQSYLEEFKEIPRNPGEKLQPDNQ